MPLNVTGLHTNTHTYTYICTQACRHTHTQTRAHTHTLTGTHTHTHHWLCPPVCPVFSTYLSFTRASSHLPVLGCSLFTSDIIYVLVLNDILYVLVLSDIIYRRMFLIKLSINETFAYVIHGSSLCYSLQKKIEKEKVRNMVVLR